MPAAPPNLRFVSVRVSSSPSSARFTRQFPVSRAPAGPLRAPAACRACAGVVWPGTRAPHPQPPTRFAPTVPGSYARHELLSVRGRPAGRAMPGRRQLRMHRPSRVQPVTAGSPCKNAGRSEERASEPLGMALASSDGQEVTMLWTLGVDPVRAVADRNGECLHDGRPDSRAARAGADSGRTESVHWHAAHRTLAGRGPSAGVRRSAAQRACG